ncbi:unnamed protein product [Arctogadus glacialis]
MITPSRVTVRPRTVSRTAQDRDETASYVIGEGRIVDVYGKFGAGRDRTVSRAMQPLDRHQSSQLTRLVVVDRNVGGDGGRGREEQP